MARRTYKRDSHGRFAGGSGGSSRGGSGGASSPKRRTSAQTAAKQRAAKRPGVISSPENGFKAQPRARKRRSLLTKKEKTQLKRQLAVIGTTYAIGVVARQVMVSRAGKLAAASRDAKRTAASARLAGNTLTTQRGSSGRYGSLPTATKRKRRSGAYKISSL